uniref:Mitochondrial import inner membrane translocase subunit TIM14 n=1 Tax=Ursus maritimus TaxID=29073 RepID=A0A452TM78_URSMA
MHVLKRGGQGERVLRKATQFCSRPSAPVPFPMGISKYLLPGSEGQNTEAPALSPSKEKIRPPTNQSEVVLCTCPLLERPFPSGPLRPPFTTVFRPICGRYRRISLGACIWAVCVCRWWPCRCLVERSGNWWLRPLGWYEPRSRWRPGSQARAMAFSGGYYRGGFEPKMTKREAALILGVSPTANKGKIRDAHRRIMLLNHPDKGGSPYIAAKINEAKDLLEGQAKK